MSGEDQKTRNPASKYVKLNIGGCLFVSTIATLTKVWYFNNCWNFCNFLSLIVGGLYAQSHVFRKTRCFNRFRRLRPYRQKWFSFWTNIEFP